MTASACTSRRIPPEAFAGCLLWPGVVSRPMAIAVLGAGAIGGLVAARLATSGDEPLLLTARGAHGAALADQGLRLDEPDGPTTRIGAARWQVHLAPLEAGPVCEVVLVCGKAHRTAAMLADARRLCGPDTIVASLQNGLGHADALVDGLGASHVVGGLTTHGVTRLGPGHVRWAGIGSVVLGPLPGLADAALAARLDALIERLDRAGLHPVLSADITHDLWVKLALNAVINPVACLAGQPNGALLAQPRLAALARDMLVEVVAVATASGVGLDAGPLEQRLHDVLKATASNRCSMLQDLDAGRVTEIEGITGEIVRRAAASGLSVPLNEALLGLVCARHPPRRT